MVGCAYIAVEDGVFLYDLGFNLLERFISEKVVMGEMSSVFVLLM